MRIFLTLTLTLLITHATYANPIFMFNRTHGFLGSAEVRGAWIDSAATNDGSDADTFKDVFITQNNPGWIHISVSYPALKHGGRGLVVLMRKGACVAKNPNPKVKHDQYDVQYHSGVWRRALSTRLADWFRGDEVDAVFIHRPIGHPWSRVQFRIKLAYDDQNCGAVFDPTGTMKIRFRIQTTLTGWRLHREIFHKTLYEAGYLNGAEWRSIFDLDSDGDIDGTDIQTARGNPVDFNEDGVINDADNKLHQRAREAYEGNPAAPMAPRQQRTLTTVWAIFKKQ